MVMLLQTTWQQACWQWMQSGQKGKRTWLNGWSLFSPIKKMLKTIMDAKIEGQYSQEAAFQAAQLSLKCLEYLPKQSPSMKDVLNALEAIEDIQVKSEESKNLNSH